jgi:hypothetical protein
MRRALPEWQTLNAYVDGELDARGAAAVAEAAGNDTSIADQIACLYQLKGVMPSAAPAAPGNLRELVPNRSRRLPTGILAACSAVAMVVAVALLWLRAEPPVALPDGALVAARTLHEDWLATESLAQSEAPPSLVMAALSQFRRVPVIPDLTSTKLTIERVTVTDQPAGHMLQVGYRGNHGCHLSMFIFDNGNLPSQMVQEDRGAERAYGWEVEELGYLLFAEGMDSTRFDLIAHKVEAATRSGMPFDEQTRQVLAENKAKSANCAA